MSINAHSSGWMERNRIEGHTGNRVSRVAERVFRSRISDMSASDYCCKTELE